MARRTTTTSSTARGRGRGRAGSAGSARGGAGGGTGAGADLDDAGFEENIVDIDVTDEMRTSYLEYAYSVIYQRALPDARDGLKPVQRRILFQMSEMGLRPDRAYVKCAQVVGAVMGRLHPHGDGAIYDAMVRMHQPWAMRLPLVDGHGNFGSPDDGPAAYRYTEARMAEAAATAMTDSLGEDTVDFVPNYDGTLTQPEVLPAAFPNLLVNGTAGIAVGMATNMAPHNLGEVVAAARHLIASPEADLETLMRFVPGPDLPTGGKIVGLDGIREAYQTGRGLFRTRATARIEKLTPRRTGIVVTELPYGVGPERVISRIKDLIQARKLTGVADVPKDLTDMKHGLRLVIEVRSGFVPEAVLDELYRLTPLEETFGINNVALVNGQPQVLGLRELLQIYVDFRLETVRRRCEFRRGKRQDRLHLVEGLIIALLNIDEVIQVIRTSDDAAAAKERLMAVFDLTEIQAQYILDTPLRRLTRYDRLELERERDTLASEIAGLTEILESEPKLRQLVSGELATVSEKFATPRRTVLLEGSGAAARSAAAPLEVADEPCSVLLSSAGLLARTAGRPPARAGRGRAAHDVIVSSVSSTARGTFGVITSAGRLIRLGVLELPALPPSAHSPALSGGAPLSEFVTTGPGETVVAIVAADSAGADGAGADSASAGLALATAQGVVKRVTPDYPQNATEFDVIALRDGDRVVGAVQLASDDQDLVFITSDAQLLRFPASSVRPQGRAAAGMAGIRLAPRASVIWFGAVSPFAAESAEADGADSEPVVVTIAGAAGALPGTMAATAKVTPFAEYPAKGRGTGGVRCHRFLKGEDVLVLAWAGPGPARGATEAGTPVDLPAPVGRRDGSGERVLQPLAAVGGTVPAA